MELEHRYIVLKNSDVAKLNVAERTALANITRKIARIRDKRGAHESSVQCVVIEKHWPEFEPTVALLAARVEQPFPENLLAPVAKHSHYKKDIRHLKMLDIYRVLELFPGVPHAIGHAVKKLLVPGVRGGGKTVEKDYQEAIDSIKRQMDMMTEDIGKLP